MHVESKDLAQEIGGIRRKGKILSERQYRAAQEEKSKREAEAEARAFRVGPVTSVDEADIDMFANVAPTPAPAAIPASNAMPVAVPANPAASDPAFAASVQQPTPQSSAGGAEKLGGSTLKMRPRAVLLQQHRFSPIAKPGAKPLPGGSPESKDKRKDGKS